MYRRSGRQLNSRDILLARVLITVVCVILTSVGIAWAIKTKSTMDRASEPVKAQIVELDRVTETERIDGRYRERTVEYPIVEYEFNGETYSKRLSIGRNVGAYYKGETLDININPDDPREVYEPGSVVFVILFIVLPIFVWAFINGILSAMTH